jgi:hypothetical protein
VNAPTEPMLGDDGKPMDPARADMIRAALAAMEALTADERRRVMCWFCPECLRYVGPGDHCYCPPGYDE